MGAELIVQLDPTIEHRARVGEAARRLVELRDGWLNPPGLAPGDLDKRTLTNLYNQRPTWLANAHTDLDAAVLAPSVAGTVDGSRSGGRVALCAGPST